MMYKLKNTLRSMMRKNLYNLLFNEQCEMFCGICVDYLLDHCENERGAK